MNFAVAVAVLAVAAGTFFLSYPGVHAIARQGGVSGQLARFYPALFDAVLVIACVAAVMLRDSRWWARGWAWLVAIVVLGAIGATDVLHAMSYGLRQRPTEGVVAAAPAAAVLLAFSLFLTMLRQSRPQPPEANRGQAPAQQPDDGRAVEQPTAPMLFSAVDTVPVRVLAAGTAPRPPAPPIALPVVPAGPQAADVTDGSDLAPTAPAAVTGSTEPTEPTPTQEVPALVADASDTRDAGGSGDANASGDIGDAGESGETQAPSAAVASETSPEPTSVPASEPTSERTPDTADETADEASGKSDEASEQPEPQPKPPTVATGTATAPQAIRYASSAAAEQFANEDWEAEVDPALAGQVYPVLTSDPDIEVPPHQPGQSRDLEDDAPPFATAPFASVPRLNRVRVTPTPPTDDADEE